MLRRLTDSYTFRNKRRLVDRHFLVSICLLCFGIGAQCPGRELKIQIIQIVSTICYDPL